MKTSFAALVLVLPAVLSHAATENVASNIAGVTVYPDRAVVSRTAHVRLAAGEHDLVLGDLPASLLEDSVQVAATGNAPATILDVSTRSGWRPPAADTRIEQVRASILALRSDAQALADRISVLEKQRTFVTTLQQAGSAPTRDGVRATTDELRALLGFSGDALSQSFAEQRQVEARKREIDTKIQVLENELTPMEDDAAQPGTAVTLRMNVSAPAELDLRVTYAVSDAQWRPAYDARLRSADRKIELDYFGVVTQSTGEDWNRVPLTLSTARPALGGAAPKLSPWEIDVRSPEPLPVPPSPLRKESPRRAPAPVAPLAELEASSDEVNAELSQAELSASLTSASFRISAPATVKSDNSVQKVSITTMSLPAELRYEATPVLQPTAYLSATATNTSEFPLLAGPVSAFLDDAFVATGPMKTVMPKETLTVALGADEAIAITRKEVGRFTENTGFSNSGRRVTYDSTITVHNQKKTQEQLVLKDRLPVSRNEQIVVKAIAPTDSEATREPDGIRTWTLTLAPGEKRVVPVKFTVEYPGKLDVSGLD